MPVLVGIFDSQSTAERAYIRLRETGVPEDNLALVSTAHTDGRPTSAAELQAERTGVAAPDAGVDVVHPVDPSVDEVPDHPASAGVTPANESENRGLDGAALGAAIGVIAGAGVGGPLGAVAGAAVGSGIGAFFAGRGVNRSEADSYEEAVRLGRFLVAVETDEPTPEMRAILEVSGAERLELK
jgi:hypothetical protein